MWPCGIITSLSELYYSESKSLVYGYLHDMYNALPEVSSTISKFLCITLSLLMFSLLIILHKTITVFVKTGSVIWYSSYKVLVVVISFILPT